MRRAVTAQLLALGASIGLHALAFEVLPGPTAREARSGDRTAPPAASSIVAFEATSMSATDHGDGKGAPWPRSVPIASAQKLDGEAVTPIPPRRRPRRARRSPRPPPPPRPSPAPEGLPGEIGEHEASTGAPRAVESDGTAAAKDSVGEAAAGSLPEPLAVNGTRRVAGTEADGGEGSGAGRSGTNTTGAGDATPGDPLADNHAEEEALRAITRRLFAAATPCYPRSAQMRGQEGVAQMRFCLDARGTPSQISLVRSSGFAQLDVAARCTIERAAPFPPLPGRCLTVPIRFALRRR